MTVCLEYWPPEMRQKKRIDGITELDQRLGQLICLISVQINYKVYVNASISLLSMISPEVMNKLKV